MDSAFKNGSAVLRTALTILAIALVGAVLLLGRVSARLENGVLYLSDGTLSREAIACSDVTAVEWRDSLERGSRVFGVGSLRLSSGRYSNREFGPYTLYVWNAVPACVVVRHSGGVAVFNADTPEAARALYQNLLAACS